MSDVFDVVHRNRPQFSWSYKGRCIIVSRSIPDAVPGNYGALSYYVLPSPDRHIYLGASGRQTKQQNASTVVLHNLRYPQWADKFFLLSFFPGMSGTFLVSRGVGVFATDATTTAVDSTNVAFAIVNNLRIASLSIAAYECVINCVSSTPLSDSLADQLFHHSPC
jgi:hypothetical protein